MAENEAIKEFQQNIDMPFGSNISREASELAIQALEKQIEMKKYCDENDCVDCPYHNISLKDNRCMNDFIIDKE